MRISYEHVKNWQQFEILAKILKAAFGDGKSNGVHPNAVEPKSVEEANALLRSMFGK